MGKELAALKAQSHANDLTHDQWDAWQDKHGLILERDALDDLLSMLVAQPAPVQEPVAEVKAKMTGGNVGIATVIHEIYSPHREPLQPGDKLYSGHRWIGWDIEQVWSERIFGVDMRFENVQDAIKFRNKLDEAAPPAQPAPVPVEWMEMVAVNLLREGVNKHKARELAEHFYRLHPSAAQTAPCTWTKSNDPSMPDTFDATCGVVWTFTDGGPVENDVRFCPGCGGKVVEGQP
jgi:hypothetical protein